MIGLCDVNVCLQLFFLVFFFCFFFGGGVVFALEVVVCFLVF